MSDNQKPNKERPPQHRNRDYKAELERKKAQGKDLGGRPRFQIDYDKLKTLCGMFCTEVEVAAVLGCSVNTLTIRLKQDYQEALEANDGEVPIDRYDGFRDAFEKCAALGRVSLRRTQFKMATDPAKPDKTMAIWMGKNYLEQSDRIDHTSKGEKINQPGSVDLSKLDHNEFDALGKILHKTRTMPESKTRH